MTRIWPWIERSYPLLVAALLIATALPVWLADWLPLERWGDTLTTLDIMWRLDDPTASYADRFVAPGALEPNTLTLRFAALLGPFLGTLYVAKLLATFGLVMLPLSMAAVARGFGRSRWMIFLLAPLAWGGAMHAGALDVVVALPLLFGSLAAVQRLTRAASEPLETVSPQNEPSSGARAGLGLVLLLFALYYADLTLFVAAWLLTVVLLVSSCSLRDAWVRLPLWVLPLPLLGRFFAQADLGTALEMPKGPDDVGLPAERFLTFSSDTLGMLNDSIDDRILTFMLVFWLLATLSPRSPNFRPWDKDAGLPWRRHFRVELIALAALSLYLFVPNQWGEITWLGNRLAVVAVALVLLTPRVDWSAGIRRWAVVAFIALAATYITLINIRLTVFSIRTGARLATLIESLPDGSQLGLGTRLTDAWPTGTNAIATLASGMHATFNGRESGTHVPLSYRALRHAPGGRQTTLSVEDLSTNLIYAFDHVLVDGAQEVKLLKQRQGVTERSKWGPWTLFDVKPTRPLLEALPGGTGPVTYRWQCPPRHHLIGFDISPNDTGTMGTIRPFCRRWQKPTKGQRKAYKPMPGPPWGERTKADDEPIQLRCPETESVVGLVSRGDPHWGLWSLALQCAASDNALSASEEPTTTKAAETTPLLSLANTRQPVVIECPDRHLAVGIRILEGANRPSLGGVGLACLRP